VSSPKVQVKGKKGKKSKRSTSGSTQVSGGQDYTSTPNPTPSASQQELLQHYGAPTGAPQAGPTPAPSGNSSVSDVLDYLLGR
jgi:hypothetical protein